MERTAEKKLLKRFERHGDESAFRRLYREHTPMIYAMALRLCAGSGPEAEELVQEAWVRAVERLAAFRGGSTFRTWLCGILLNCYREAARRRSREAPSLEPADAYAQAGRVAEFPSGRAAGARRAASIDVERAMRQLPRRYREVVVLHDLYGYTHREISDRLGISEGTSKSQLARGRDRFRALLHERQRQGKRGQR